jgi:hypothetical protein
VTEQARSDREHILFRLCGCGNTSTGARHRSDMSRGMSVRDAELSALGQCLRHFDR